MTNLDHATVLLELFEDGRKVDERVGENYVTPYGLEYARWRTRQTFFQGISSNNTDLEPTTPFAALVVTTAPDAIDTDSNTAEGVVVGWANKQAYSGPDLFRGGMNIPECVAETGFCRWVFDWPSHSAVGTIRSVGWAPAPTNSFSPVRPGFHVTQDQTDWIAGSNVAMMRLPSGLVWIGAASNTQPRLIDPESLTYQGDWGPTANQIGSLPGNAINGAAHDGTDVFVVGGGTIIRTFPMPSGPGAVSASSISVPGVTQMVDIAYDGTMLWVLDQTGQKVVRAAKTTAEVDREFSIAGHFTSAVYGLAYDPDRNTLLVSGAMAGTPNNAATVCEFDLDGQLLRRLQPMGGSTANYKIAKIGPDRYLFDYLQTSQRRYRGDIVAGSRVLLPSPVTKNSLQTMKVTYTFTYT